ncbi:MAG: GAF domain-containing protein [Anaerolineales bacterium]|nr:GAF domain-containing protein [Anaerolineales bacterium]
MSSVETCDANEPAQTLNGCMKLPSEDDAPIMPLGWKTYEKQIRALVEHSAESFSLLNAEGTILYTGPVTEQILGYAVDEFVGRNVFEFLHAEDIPDCKNLFLLLLQNEGSTYRTRFRFLHKSGTWRWLEGVGTNLLENQDFRALLINFRDITAEILAQKTLDQRMLFDQAMIYLSKKLELALDYDEIIQVVKDVVQTNLGYQNVWMYLSNEADELTLLSSAGKLNDIITTQAQTLRITGDKFLEELWQSQTVFVVTDAQTDPRTNKELVARFGNRTIINAPMILQGRLLGFLGTGSFGAEGVRAPTPEQLEFFSGMGIRVAVAVSRVQLQAEVEQRVRFTVLLNSMAQIALAATDLREMLYQMVDRLAEMFRADACYLTLWDEERQLPIPTAAYGPLRETYPQISPEPGERNLTEVVLQAEHAIPIENIYQTPYLDASLAAKFPNPCVLALPLIASQQKLGAVILAYDKPHAFPVTEMIQAEQATAQIALAIAKTQLIASERKRREEAETLREATSILAASFDLEQILETLLAFLRRVVPYDSACVFLKEGPTLRVMAVADHPNRAAIFGKQFPLQEDHLQPEIFRTGRPLILFDAQADPRFLNWGEATYIRGWMGVPLLAHGEVIGVLTVDSKQPGMYTPVEADLVQAFANQAALAVENARLLESERRRRIEAETLHKVTMAFTGTLDLERLLELILTHLQQVIPYDS